MLLDWPTLRNLSSFNSVLLVAAPPVGNINPFGTAIVSRKNARFRARRRIGREFSRASALEDEARRRPLREQSSLVVHDTALGRVNATATVHDIAFDIGLARLATMECTCKILNLSVVPPKIVSGRV